MHQTSDVVIIGAGVNGASLAYHLALAGVRRIVVLEKQVVAAGKALAEQIMGVGTSPAVAVTPLIAPPEISITSLRPARYFEDATIADRYAYSDRPQDHTESPN